MKNEPVFPQQELDAQGNPREALQSGLTKLEYIATAALRGILANEGRHARVGLDAPTTDDPAKLAKAAVAYTEALLTELAAREVLPDPPLPPKS